MTVHVETVGAGPPLVLLHGWAMHSGLWQPILPRLARSHRVYLVDLPGHGHSSAVEPYTLDRIVTALDACFASDEQPLRVLGWSLGGLVAMRWARTHHKRIERLALMCTSPLYVRRADWPHAMDAQTLSRFGDELQVSFRATLLRFLTLQVKDSEQGKASLSLLRARLFERGEPSRETLRRGLALLADSDLRVEAGGLAQPVLVLAGERDMLTPAGAGEWLAQRMQHGRFELIEGAGHAPFLSHPERFFAALEGFISA